MNKDSKRTCKTIVLLIKALANEDILLRTYRCPWCFLGCANWETFVADTKCFWIKSETFLVSWTQNLCPQQMLRARANGEKFVSATNCVRVFQGFKPFTIRRIVFFLSIGREPTMWPTNNCLQIMVCSCVVPSKRVLLQIIFCSCVIGTTFSREKWQIASLSCQEVIKIWKHTWWSSDKTIAELGYRKISWFASVSQIWKITIFCLTSSNDC